MKRTEINKLVREAMEFCKQNNFNLPEWTSWSPAQWNSKGKECLEIKRNCLGWDITDFGSGDFYSTGLTLVTLRNGNPAYDSKCYCEKIMFVRDGQVTPIHFHWKKTEDIIFRSGDGEFCMKLWKAAEDESMMYDDVIIKVDGVETVVKAGEVFRIKPGQSVTYEPYLYHTFWAEGGNCLVGEVSMVNDDSSDNRFYEKTGRFPEIEEDVPAEYLLCNEYPEL